MHRGEATRTGASATVSARWARRGSVTAATISSARSAAVASAVSLLL